MKYRKCSHENIINKIKYYSGSEGLEEFTVVTTRLWKSTPGTVELTRVYEVVSSKLPLMIMIGSPLNRWYQIAISTVKGEYKWVLIAFIRANGLRTLLW